MKIEGYWWARHDDNEHPEIIEIEGGVAYVFGSNRGYALSYYDLIQKIELLSKGE